MADSKLATVANGCDRSLMIAAMAYRVKYRKLNSAGNPQKFPVRIESAGVHRKNRGGVYPAGVRCKSLAVDVIEAGFLKEEVNHVCVAVEEAPLDEIIKSGAKDYVSASLYNAERSAKDELLCTCFQAPFNVVHWSFLSHNHMLLIMRAFLTQAKWDIPPDTDRDLFYCDLDGRLSLNAVAECHNAKELAEVMAEGLLTEVLSWKMDVEEPGAASIISQALNQPQQVSMHTTTLTAVAVLKGEIILQMSKDVGQRVAFQTVRDRVRSQLHTAADDPDLPEVFDFLISVGVGQNSYVDHLLEWTSCYVDSTKRQLRFAAFEIVNKMCEQAVWSKIAVVKRAYRKKPVMGYCPSPEPAWAKFAWAHVQMLEDVLRFFHVACKAIMDEMKPQSRIQLLANVDIAAAETFWAAKTAKMTYGQQKIGEQLLERTKRYLEPLKLDEDPGKLKSLPGRPEWIIFTKDPEPAHAGATAVEPNSAPTVSTSNSAPTVIKFDEITGQQLNQQLDFSSTAASQTSKKDTIPEKLPWREWRSGVGSSMGEAEAEQANAVAVLHALHGNFNVDLEPIEVWATAACPNYVTATRKAKPRDIMLPPCITKQSRVHPKSEHPFAVEVTCRLIQPAGSTTPVEDATTVRKTTYFLNPEWRGPLHYERGRRGHPTAEAAVADEEQFVWGPRGHETMHPFWAVRRMTQKQLAREVALAAEGKYHGTMRPRFNCGTEAITLSCVTVGVVRSETVNTTRVFDVPFLTNTVDLEEGEELILEVREKSRAKEQQKRTWKQAFKAEEQKEKGAKEMMKKCSK